MRSHKQIIIAIAGLSIFATGCKSQHKAIERVESDGSTSEQVDSTKRDSITFAMTEDSHYEYSKIEFYPTNDSGRSPIKSVANLSIVRTAKVTQESSSEVATESKRESKTVSKTHAVNESKSEIVSPQTLLSLIVIAIIIIIISKLLRLWITTHKE